MIEALRPFGDRPRVLPLSGGLDSRLLLATGDFDFGYTFGPEHSGDRPVARRFRRRISRYLEFSLLDLEYPERLRTAGREMFRGVCPRPFLELLAVHRHVHANAPRNARAFDGYLGDVLKRGTYLTSGGMRGSIAKLLPSLTLRGFDPRGLLRRRYAAIGERGLERLEACYSEFERRTPLGDPHRLMLFEILHGRGARYTLNGGTLLAGQYFSVVQPYFLPEVFRTAFPVEVDDLLAYRILHRIWKNAPEDLAKVRTYSGFRPTDNPTLNRATMLATKGLARLGVRTRSISYEDELPRLRWS